MERSQNWKTLYHLLHMKFRRSGLVDTLVAHANTNGNGQTSLDGVSSGFMPPQLKTKQGKPVVYYVV